MSENISETTLDSPAPNNKIGKFRNIITWQWFLFGLLQAFNLYVLLNHAMWRDELHTWSMVRNSSTLMDLFYNMRYEGFPPLWFIALWGLSFLSSAPLTMQLFHFACSLVAQLLVMFKAPFSLKMKFAIIAGYYISFEYCIISRAYVLGVLIIFIYCSFDEWLSSRPLARGTILGLLANTSVYGSILSLAIVVNDIVEVIISKNTNCFGSSRKLGQFLLTYGLFLSVAITFMVPPADSFFAVGWDFKPPVLKTFALFCRSLICLLPVPVAKVTFWNSLYFFEVGAKVAFLVSMGIIALLWFALRSSPRYLRLFAIGFIGIWTFQVIKYIGYVRHAGTVMILFIACIWLAAKSSKINGSPASFFSQIAIWVILAMNLVAWGMASYYHFRYDFSGSREMAQFIRNYNNTLPIVADIDYATYSVAGYLDRPFYYARKGKLESFLLWNTEGKNNVGRKAALRLAQKVSGDESSDILLLLNYPLMHPKARLLTRTTNPTIVEDEYFYLYHYVSL
jgi:hypothetical protein